MSYTGEEVEDFYEEVTLMSQKGKCYIKLIVGDWNAIIGAKEKSQFSEQIIYMGCGMKEDRLIEFA